MPLRSSSAGVPMAPAAATNARARTVTLRAVGATPSASIANASSSVTRPFAMMSRSRAHACHQRGAFGQCARNRGDEHRLLGVGRAAHPAVTEIRAAFDVAADRRGRDADLARAPRQRFVVGIGCDVPGRDRQARFHLREPWRHRFHGEIGQPELALPVRERHRRRAERTGPVHRGAAADATSLQDVDRLVLGLARRRLLIQLRIRFGFEHVEIARRLERSFFQQHDAQAGIGKNLRRGAATRAGSHDRHVRFERDVAREGATRRSRPSRMRVRRPPDRRSWCPPSRHPICGGPP